MKGHLQCAEQQESPLQHHQIVRLPPKITVISDPANMKLISNAQSSKSHPATSPRLPRKMNVMIDPAHV